MLHVLYVAACTQMLAGGEGVCNAVSLLPARVIGLILGPPKVVPFYFFWGGRVPLLKQTTEKVGGLLLTSLLDRICREGLSSGFLQGHGA